MSIDRESLMRFAERPERYVLRYDAKVVRAEKKGFFTWIKAHLPWMSHQYKLDRILKVFSSIEDKGETSPLKARRFQEAISRNVERYNDRPKHETKINSCFQAVFKNEESKDTVLARVRENGLDLREIPGVYTEDRDVVRAAVQQNPDAFFFAARKLKKDKPFVMDLLKHNSEVFAHIDKKLQHDPEVLAVRNARVDFAKGDLRNMLFEHKEYRKDPVFMLEAYKVNDQALNYMDRQLKNNADFMLKAMKINPDMAFRIGEELRDDADFMRKAIEIHPNASFYIGSKLCENREFLLEIIPKNPEVLKQITNELKHDKEFVTKALNLIQDEFTRGVIAMFIRPL